MNNDYRCCSYCRSFMKDLNHKFLFEHQTEDKFCCTKKECMYEYMSQNIWIEPFEAKEVEIEEEEEWS